MPAVEEGINGIRMLGRAGWSRKQVKCCTVHVFIMNKSIVLGGGRAPCWSCVYRHTMPANKNKFFYHYNDFDSRIYRYTFNYEQKYFR